jgi:hypothetical protein
MEFWKLTICCPNNCLKREYTLTLGMVKNCMLLWSVVGKGNDLC